MSLELSATQKKVAIITNNLHCERHYQYITTMEKYFRFNGWVIADHFDVNKIVICGCGFHDAMWEKVHRALQEIRSTNFLEKNIIITACMPKTQAATLEQEFHGQVVDLGKEEELDETINAKIPFKEIRLVNMYRIHEKCQSATQEHNMFHVKISQGCLRECTFCVINKAKGLIKSVPMKEITDQVLEALAYGKKKVFLMGEDTFAWGIDIGSNIIELVNHLKKVAPQVELLFGYLHIRWLQKYAKDILALCTKGVFKELHIGLQHVDDEILDSMGRPVVFSEVYEIIKNIKKELPDFYMIADIMVGFPGETDSHFNKLIEFFKQDKCFNKVKHFGYSSVKGSRSSLFENQIPNHTITARWDALDKVLGERAYSEEDNESRLDNETFRITRFDDYSFCKNTYVEDFEGKAAPEELATAESKISKESGDFNF